MQINWQELLYEVVVGAVHHNKYVSIDIRDGHSKTIVSEGNHNNITVTIHPWDASITDDIDDIDDIDDEEDKEV